MKNIIKISIKNLQIAYLLEYYCEISSPVYDNDLFNKY